MQAPGVIVPIGNNDNGNNQGGNGANNEAVYFIRNIPVTQQQVRQHPMQTPPQGQSSTTRLRQQSLNQALQDQDNNLRTIISLSLEIMGINKITTIGQSHSRI